MNGMLSGQVALITGGGRGFGKAIALRFAVEGAAVTVTSRTQAELDKTAAEIEAAGGQGLAVAGDVTRPEDVSRAVRTTTEKFGPITLLVNNAGIPGPFAPIWVADPDEWWFAQEVHIRAPFMFIREILPSMIERRAGRIIMVSAMGSHRLDASMSPYCLGKCAQNRLIQLVDSETREFGINAFSIDPGFAITELAEITMRDPGAQRWKPEMIQRLKERKAEPDALADLERCAQRCLSLASGRYDELSGSYTELSDDLDEMLRQVRAARK
jgi:NAD(P)-dependent dehydrogenase (short-subunit alcohol dehydrogenase family)